MLKSAEAAKSIVMADFKSMGFWNRGHVLSWSPVKCLHAKCPIHHNRESWE